MMKMPMITRGCLSSLRRLSSSSSLPDTLGLAMVQSALLPFRRPRMLDRVSSQFFLHRRDSSTHPKSNSPPCSSTPLATEETSSQSTSSHIEYDLSPEGQHYKRAYVILSSLVVPRPIALITTMGADGSLNAAPYSFFNLLGSDPPIVAFGPYAKDASTLKDTHHNALTGRNFVVNLVDEGLVEAMNKCAASLPYGKSELDFAGLTVVPSSMVSSPRLLNAPASLECTLPEENGNILIGNNRVVFGIVQRVHIRADLVKDPVKGRVNRKALGMIGRLQSPGWYCRTRDDFLLEVPEVPLAEKP